MAIGTYKLYDTIKWHINTHTASGSFVNCLPYSHDLSPNSTSINVNSHTPTSPPHEIYNWFSHIIHSSTIKNQEKWKWPQILVTNSSHAFVWPLHWMFQTSTSSSISWPWSKALTNISPPQKPLSPPNSSPLLLSNPSLSSFLNSSKPHSHPLQLLLSSFPVPITHIITLHLPIDDPERETFESNNNKDVRETRVLGGGLVCEVVL